MVTDPPLQSVLLSPAKFKLRTVCISMIADLACGCYRKIWPRRHKKSPVFRFEDRGEVALAGSLSVVVLALGVLADHVGGVEGQHDAGGDHHSRFLLYIYRRVA